MTDLFNYHRRPSVKIDVGDTPMGDQQPIRIQSMATVSTNDIEGSVAQARRIIDAGGEYVRFTTQGTREAENIGRIHDALRQQGITTPLVADVHFNARVAEVAAKNVEKVRINPGNYVDPARTFKKLEYTDEEYDRELHRIEERLLPLLQICREHHTALRIGVNHGSLSDRIMSHYGDTPEGIVESCMEFLRICQREKFNNVVISIKASNTVVMVRSMRLLVAEMDKEDMHYPLHLGVTEAGEGEDGRIKSAVGIGALLADGIGDTVRVSLSEEPEQEIPVARHLVDHFTGREHHPMIPATPFEGFDYLRPERRVTHPVGHIGGDNVPVVILSGKGDEEFYNDQHPDFIYTGKEVPSQRKDGQRLIVDFNVYDGQADTFPIFPAQAMPWIGSVEAPIKFLVLSYGVSAEEYIACLRLHPEVVVVAVSHHANPTGELRALTHEMMRAGLNNPIVFCHAYAYQKEEKDLFQIDAAADMGALMIDGLTDGIWLMNDGDIAANDIAATALGILQAARLRVSKTEYISCPGCGRTLYNLQATIAKIKAATQHMKGLKIGIMGCIVNGPGEMADADFGYVGAGPGRISLYRRKECVERNIPEEEAVEHLLKLIRQTIQEKES
jgi:(E)-4-hydroxy-3-methylbut-2-enyl-diphosphate synthase